MQQGFTQDFFPVVRVFALNQNPQQDRAEKLHPEKVLLRHYPN
jgi:hypothetical protein